MSMSNDEYKYLFKIVIIGDSGVGKTSLLKQFTDGTFSTNYVSTIGVDFGIKDIRSIKEDIPVRLQIWDTAGQERFKNIVSSYYRGAKGIFIIFDLTERSSFQQIVHWYSELEKQLNLDRNSSSFPTVMLIGNKNDIDKKNHEVEEKELENFANSLNNNTKWFLTSAKDKKSVDHIFQILTEDLITKINILNHESQSQSQSQHKGVRLDIANQGRENLNSNLEDNSNYSKIPSLSSCCSQ